MEAVFKHSIGYLIFYMVFMSTLLMFKMHHDCQQQAARHNRQLIENGLRQVLRQNGSQHQQDPAVRINFENFDNKRERRVNDADPFIVPNIVHLVYLEATKLRFHQMMCIYSIYLNQKPDMIIIHCDNCSLHGYYWEQIVSKVGLRNTIKLNQLDGRRKIFNQLGNFVINHRSDFWRIMILMEFGGIFLDNDVFLVRSLDKFRKYEMTVGFEQEAKFLMGNQVLIANRNARFLKAWSDTYRTHYLPTHWYTNAGDIPGRILKAHPYLAHFVTGKLGVSIWTYRIYLSDWSAWKKMYTLHLLINHRHYLDKANYAKVKEFDEINVFKLNNTFGKMARNVLKRMKSEI